MSMSIGGACYLWIGPFHHSTLECLPVYWPTKRGMLLLTRPNNPTLEAVDLEPTSPIPSEKHPAGCLIQKQRARWNVVVIIPTKRITWFGSVWTDYCNLTESKSATFETDWYFYSLKSWLLDFASNGCPMDTFSSRYLWWGGGKQSWRLLAFFGGGKMPKMSVIFIN